MLNTDLTTAATRDLEAAGPAKPRSEHVMFATYPSPVGPLLLAGTERELHRIEFPEGRGRRGPRPGWLEADLSSFQMAASQLDEYFAGIRRAFDLTIAPEGTPFQRAVWQALRSIPYGATVSYAELAGRIGRPRAMRAVGAANGANPIPIVIPCHRVIGANGTLTGFGGGLATKERLLALEGAWPRQ